MIRRKMARPGTKPLNRARLGLTRLGAGCLIGLMALTPLAPQPAQAQSRAESLADIRSELSTLASQLVSLKGELMSSGAQMRAAGGPGALDRMNAIEAELSRLTAATESLENRINRVVSDGTNRIGDLEFRLCEMEEGCDIGALPVTATLGGGGGAGAGAGAGAASAGATGSPANSPVPAPRPGGASSSAAAGGAELAIGEKADFDRAKEVLGQGDFRRAADLFAAFAQSYPGSPLSGEALYQRGEALGQLGQTADAARAYLDGFSADMAGSRASDNLLKLGLALGQLGQVQEACVTLAEVGTRFPDRPAATEARAAYQRLTCR